MDKITLKLVSGDSSLDTSYGDDINKEKRRGRPKKQGDGTEELIDNKVCEIEEAPKKRGRKKKHELLLSPSILNPSQGEKQTSSNNKSYIATLKVTAEDLDKIQNNYIKEINNGYQDAHSRNNIMGSVGFENFSEICDSTQNSHLLHESECICVLPNNIPIKLFDEGTTCQREQNFKSTEVIMLPQLTQDNQQWPQSSPYPCWNCDIYFDGTPIGIIDKEHGTKIQGYGNCCSFPCVARYMVDRENVQDFSYKYSLLCMLYQQVYNLPVNTKVPIAPPREALTKYGGKLSYDEYHDQTIYERKVEVYKLPLVPVLLHIGELSKFANISAIVENNRQQHSVNSSNVIESGKLTRYIGIDPHKLKRAEFNLKMQQQSRISDSQLKFDNN